jgi:hypothetical protein
MMFCPGAFYGASCVDRVVLLSALKDGIVRIDDSEGKRRWKPGPEWTNLEKLLLSQPGTDAMPSWWEVYRVVEEELALVRDEDLVIPATTSDPG